MQYKPLIFLIILFFYSNNFLLRAELIINEVCTSNKASAIDEDMGTPDWIEIKNTGDTGIRLKGYRLSDKYDIGSAWILPDTMMRAGGHILIYASGKGRNGRNSIFMESTNPQATGDSISEAYRYEYITVSGDFDFRCRISSLTGAGAKGYAGIVFRDNLKENSPFISNLSLTSDTCFSNAAYYRRAEQEESRIHYFPKSIKYPDHNIGLSRDGDTITTTVYDRNWYPYQTYKKYFPIQDDKHYIGIALSSGGNEYLARADYSEIRLNKETISHENFKSTGYDCSFIKSCYNNGTLHCDFKLKKSGETIYLWTPDAECIDTLSIPWLPSDVSYGRRDGDKVFNRYFSPATPMLPNTYSYAGIAPTPTFSSEAGIYATGFELNLSIEDMSSTIRYTTDGSVPNQSSEEYIVGNFLQISESTIIRARAFRPGFLPGKTISKTYILGESTELPVISIAGSPYEIFDESSGLLSDEHIDLKQIVPVSFEYIDHKNAEYYANDAEIIRHGHGGALINPASMRIYADNEYGNNEFYYPFWGDNGPGRQNKLLLRNSGQDRLDSYLRDGFYYCISERLTDVHAMEYRPVVVYINGKYWALLNLRSRLDPDYIGNKYGIAPDSINLMEDNDYIRQGSGISYFQMLDTLQNYTNIDDRLFSKLDSVIDMDNYCDYMALQFHSGNFDFGDNNKKFWSSVQYDNKWRWIVYDMDWTFNCDNYASHIENTMLERFIGECDPANKDKRFICMFTKLMDCEKFRGKFLNHSADLLNFQLHNTVLEPIIDSLAQLIRTEIGRQNEKWNNMMPYWEDQIIRMKDYAEKRPDVLRHQYVELFDLSGFSRLEVLLESNSGGKVRINSNYINNYPWSGYYFNRYKFCLEAEAWPGYKFDHWLCSDENLLTEEQKTSQNISIALSDSVQIEAVFSEAGANGNDIVINEIMYKSKEDGAEDWIELYNPNETTVAIGNWILKDDNDGHSYYFESNSEIESKAYIVLCKDSESFSVVHPGVVAEGKEFNFGFGTKDMVRLYDTDGLLIDSVAYSNTHPWPEGSDETGFSMELKDPLYDNTLAKNWKSSLATGGTPGRQNSICISVLEVKQKVFNIYPNPAQKYINVEIPDNIETGMLTICDLTGRSLINYRIRSVHSVVNLEGLSPGVYVCSIVGKYAKTNTKLLIRR